MQENHLSPLGFIILLFPGLHLGFRCFQSTRQEEGAISGSVSSVLPGAFPSGLLSSSHYLALRCFPSLSLGPNAPAATLSSML